MLRLGIVACAVGALALAEGFTFTIGSPVASQDFQAKGAVFVFRTEGCTEPAKLHVGGTAEGLVKGARRSVALRVVATSRSGVYAVYQNWPNEGGWVANLKGNCANASAGAVVSIGGNGFIRESSKFFARPATDAEVDSSLKALTQGENK
jgi:hypothetical protein